MLPPPRSFSQGATSFIASRCQGIHQMPLPIAREPLDPHAPTHTRNQATGAGTQEECVIATRNLNSYEHTRSSMPGTGTRNREPGRLPIPITTLSASKTRTASDKHTPPSPTLRDDRRLDGCQNPLHIVQEPENRRQDPGTRTCNWPQLKSLNQSLPRRSRLGALLPGSRFLTPGLWNGADRSRTDDLLNANQALSQLSYGPALQEPEDRTREPGRSWLLNPGSRLLNGGPG